MPLDTYGHAMGELEGVERRSGEQVISDEREAAVRTVFARLAETAADDDFEAREYPALAGFSEKPSSGLEPLTPSLPWRCSTN